MLALKERYESLEGLDKSIEEEDMLQVKLKFQVKTF